MVQRVNLTVPTWEGNVEQPFELRLRSGAVPHTWRWPEVQHRGVPLLRSSLCLTDCLSVEVGTGCREGLLSGFFLAKAGFLETFRLSSSFPCSRVLKNRRFAFLPEGSAPTGTEGWYHHNFTSSLRTELAEG